MGLPKRYHPLMVSLHWLVAALTAVELYFGLFVFARGVPGVEHPPMLVALHMLFGMAVLALVVVRFIVRLRLPRPAEVLTGARRSIGWRGWSIMGCTCCWWL
jgi:cytochrome b561